MIIYLDTSNLVKLYVLEKNSDQIIARLSQLQLSLMQKPGPHLLESLEKKA